MYSIIEKTGKGSQNIVKFLADTDADLYRITDNCDPGSTVTVLGKKDGEEEADSKNIHTFIKTPSGHWQIYQGDTEFKPPKNDAKVSVPDENSTPANPTLINKKISDFQHDIVIQESGLVSGTLLEAESEDYGDEKKKGHFFFANLDTPEKATKYGINLDGNATKNNDHDIDGWIQVRYENITADPKVVNIKYDTGESFDFFVEDLELENGPVQDKEQE